MYCDINERVQVGVGDCCPQCGERVKGGHRARELHFGKQHRFNCLQCDRKFLSKIKLTRHIVQCHTTEPSEPINDKEAAVEVPNQSRDNHCQKCKIVFDAAELANHVQKPHPFCCDVCEFHFISEGRLHYHKITLHGAGAEEFQLDMKCRKCEECFDDADTFLYHVELEHAELCESCKMKFVSKERLNSHMKSVHPVKELMCCQCGEKFVAECADYEEHVELEHKSDCIFCEKVFTDEEVLVKHVTLSHADKVYICSYCGEYFGKDFLDWKTHEKEPHASSCRFCKKKFINQIEMVTHVNTCHNDRNFSCQFCYQEFSGTFETCLQHEELVHEIQCGNCELRFACRARHDKHSLDIHGLSVGLDLQCGQCGERFENSSMFREHFKLPHSLGCNKCELKFPSQTTLNSHLVKVHQLSPKSKKEICRFCGKKFELLDQFMDHENTAHKYNCEYCDMTFIKSSRLRDHVKEQHESSKEIIKSCKLCGTVVTKSDKKSTEESYKLHCSLSHKFPCRNCGMRFTSRAKLELHFKVESIERHTFENLEHVICTVPCLGLS